MEIRRYKESLAQEWNNTVHISRNGTFLFRREFMDYHSDRFTDCSLMFYDKRCIACMPANIDHATKTVWTHQGLTYGGIVCEKEVRATQIMEMLDMACQYFATELGCKLLIYKPIPYIYSNYPSQDDLYAIFQKGGRLISRGLSSCILIEERLKFSTLRSRHLQKAARKGIRIRETNEVEAYWNILNEVLTTHHNTSPVHSVDELKLLISRFPERIRLFGAYTEENELCAGSLIFDCGNVVHTQYLAANATGKDCGGLDAVIHYLLNTAYADRRYLDFGISTEQGGRILNEGLIFQKEGFGGRGVCYDCYEIELFS